MENQFNIPDIQGLFPQNHQDNLTGKKQTFGKISQDEEPNIQPPWENRGRYNRMSEGSRRDSKETWEGTYSNGSPPATPANKSYHDPGQLIEGLISTDRPVYLSVLNLVQQMEPSLYLSLNPLSLIGTCHSGIPEIPPDAISAMNDMIQAIHGDNRELVVPILLKGHVLAPGGRDIVRPVPGLKVLTKYVLALPNNPVEEAISLYKREYKYQDFLECVESGRSLIKLTLLGRLVTNPQRPSLVKLQKPGETRQSQSPRLRHRSRPPSHKGGRARTPSPSSIYSKSERSANSIAGKLRRALFF